MSTMWICIEAAARTLRLAARALGGALGLFGLGLLWACGSSVPLRYYTLESLPADVPISAPAPAAPVRVDRVTIPPQLDRKALVRRIAPGQLLVAESDSWAAPLDEMIHRTVSADLTARLPAGAIADPNEPATHEPRRLLFIDVSSLYGDAACAVSLHAGWILQTPNAPDKRGSEQLDVAPLAPCPGGLPPGISRALALLSDRIAAAIAQP